MCTLPKRRKTIVFEDLNTFNLTTALLFVFLRFNVFCLNFSKRLKNDLATTLLATINIRLINFEECRDIDIAITDADSREFTDKTTKELFKDDNVLYLFGSMFPGVKCIEKKIKSVVHDMVVGNCIGLSSILCWVEDYAKPGERVYLFSPNNVFRRIILKKSKFNCINLYPVWLFYVVTFFRTALNIAINISKLLYSKARWHSHSREKQSSRMVQTQPALETPDISQHEVIYFPHESVAYGSLFFKDQFYFDDPNSPFHMSRILHIELSRSVTSEEWYQKMIRGFCKNKVPFCFLPDISKRRYVNHIVFFVSFLYRNFSKIRRLRMPNRFFMTLLFLKIYIRFKCYVEILARFKSARVALVGYDVLFPKILSLALEARKITTIATQERFISGFNGSRNCILNTYLTNSEISEEKIRKKDYTCVNRFKAVGYVRSDILYRCANGSGEEPYRKIKEKQRLVLAMDYHSYLDKFTNFQQQILNWRANKAFYKDLIRLSIRFPDIYIVIRSKNDDWCRVPDMQDVYEVMEKLSNIEVNRDFRPNRGYEIASMADIAIAKYTSFGDECLAAGKPVLFYDFLPNASKAISSYFDYEKYPVFVHSYEELEERIRLFLKKGFYMDEGLFNKMKNRFFGDLYDGNVVKRVHEELMKLYSEQNSEVHLD
jgi:hypothetical protein